MNCALWLNRQKVQNASEIPDNLDVASLRGYFLAGSLVEWLRENGGAKYAEKLSEISADDPELNKKLAKIFGGKPLRSKNMQTAEKEASERKGGQTPQSVCSAVSSYRLPSSGSFMFSGYGSGSFLFANYGSGSFLYARLSSFGEFWNFLRNSGTSSFGSFNWGNYSQWEWFFTLFWRNYGSFYLGSFTSFHEWEWEWLFRLFTSGGSFSMSSFGSFDRLFWSGLFGSFTGFGSLNALPDLMRSPMLDEYDRIMLETLMRCPLDRFGYGVHNI